MRVARTIFTIGHGTPTVDVWKCWRMPRVYFRPFSLRRRLRDIAAPEAIPYRLVGQREAA